MAQALARRRARRRRKRCGACGRSRPATGFYRCAAAADGLDDWCKECRRAYLRRWIARHRAAHRAWTRAYRERNRDELRAYQREYQRRRRALMREGRWRPKAA